MHSLSLSFPLHALVLPSCSPWHPSPSDNVELPVDRLKRGRVQNYPGWDEGWLTIVKTRIQMEEEVVEGITDLELEGVKVESQVK